MQKPMLTTELTITLAMWIGQTPARGHTTEPERANLFTDSLIELTGISIILSRHRVIQTGSRFGVAGRAHVGS